MIQGLFHDKYQHWIKKRFQVSEHTTLTHQTVLIFLYRYGILYSILIILTFIAGINYANNLILGFCFLISAVLAISFYLTFKQLHGLSIEIIYPDVGRVGQDYPVQLIFKQAQAQHRYLMLETESDLKYVLLTETQQQIDLHFFPEQRGRFDLPKIKIYSTYPLGLVQTWSYLFLQHECWIAPHAEQSTRENKIQKADFTPDVDEFRELRPFQQGDSYQSVSWKQLALGQGLFVKVFEQMNEQQEIHIKYDDMPSALHEEKLSLMMYLVDYCHQHHLAYSMQLPQQSLPYEQGYVQWVNAQKLLAQA